MNTVSNREPMLSYLLQTYPPKFRIGDHAISTTDEEFTGKVVERLWLDGGWVYKIDDGTNLVGGMRIRREETLALLLWPSN